MGAIFPARAVVSGARVNRRSEVAWGLAGGAGTGGVPQGARRRDQSRTGALSGERDAEVDTGSGRADEKSFGAALCVVAAGGAAADGMGRAGLAADHCVQRQAVGISQEESEQALMAGVSGQEAAEC